MLKPPVPPNRKRALSPLAFSGGVHLALLALAAGLSRNAASEDTTKETDRPAAEARRIEMIYVPPVEPPPPPAQPPPLRPPPAPAPVRPPPQRAPPPARQTAPEPEPNARPEETRSTGAETAEKPKIEETAATLESEARRIFGRPRLMTRAGAGPQARRPMEAWLPESSERCIPQPVAPGDSAGPPQFGTVVGRIFRQDNGRPLAGAHLQMIGTPYVTFTDAAGEYHFKFDQSLMDNCRTQYVRVTAAGYESRLLVMMMGPNRSEDVRLRRR